MYLAPIHLHSTYSCTWHLFIYLAPMHVHSTYSCTWHLCMCMAPIHVHGTYACTWHLCMYMAPIHVHGTYACTWHLCMYVEVCSSKSDKLHVEMIALFSSVVTIQYVMTCMNSLWQSSFSMIVPMLGISIILLCNTAHLSH